MGVPTAILNHCRRDTVAFITTEHDKARPSPAKAPQPYGYSHQRKRTGGRDFDVRLIVIPGSCTQNLYSRRRCGDFWPAYTRISYVAAP
jgi:hypothetical protein